MKPLDAMRAVFSPDHRLSHTQRAVLAALVMCRNNDSGLCCPGQGTIAAKAGVEERTVRAIVKDLEASGVLERATAAGRSTRYALHLDKLPGLPRNDVPPRKQVPGRKQVPVTPENGSGDPGSTFRLTAVRTANELPTPGDERFEEAWNAYPKRLPSNSKSAARRAWNARLREGVDPSAIIDGVRKYAAYARADGIEGTKYVKQAATFFGPDKHWAEKWTLPDTSAPASGRELGRLR